MSKPKMSRLDALWICITALAEHQGKLEKKVLRFATQLRLAQNAKRKTKSR